VNAGALVPMSAIIGAAACAAVANVVTKRYGGALHPASLNAAAMLIGAIGLLLWSMAAGRGVPPAGRFVDVARHRLPVDRRLRDRVPRLLLAAGKVP
jgi:drug/metabolite transporter (DMT)-like permease